MCAALSGANHYALSRRRSRPNSLGVPGSRKLMPIAFALADRQTALSDSTQSKESDRPKRAFRMPDRTKSKWQSCLLVAGWQSLMVIQH